MSQKSKKTPVYQLPVSRKAYSTFVERISYVMITEHQKMVMKDTLDHYLAGDYRYADELDDDMRMAFEMLRFEVDKAIERSARARGRRRKSNENVANESRPDAPEATSSAVMYPENYKDEPQEMYDEMPENNPGESPFIPRRLHRAASNAMRPKQRWQRIG